VRQIRILLLLVIFISACNNGSDLGQDDNQEVSEMEKIVSKTDAGDFVLQLASEKMSYKPNEEIDVIGKLKYIGEKEVIEISHSESPFYFDMIEINRGVEFSYFLEDIGETTILQLNQWYEERLEKTGFSKLDDHTEFFRVFTDENGFPVGEYEIELRTDFQTMIEEESEQHNYITSIVIEVSE
jgi:hypothetical protein